MRKSVSGFTLIELLIVCVVLALLAGITYVAYTGYQRQAEGSRALVLMNTIASAAERYHNKNNEYPDLVAIASIANGAPITSTAQINAVATALNVSPDSLKTQGYRLVACNDANSDCNTVNGKMNDVNTVYYVTRHKNITTALEYPLASPNGCKVVIPAASGDADKGNSTYFMTFKDKSGNDSQWKTRRSSFGSVTSQAKPGTDPDLAGFCGPSYVFNVN